jgi:hypothetical protein
MLVGAAMLMVAARVPAAPVEATTDAAPAPLPLLAPAIVQYRWTFLAPEWRVEPRNLDARIRAPAWRPRRVAIQVLEFTPERRRIGRVAEFSCKYPDFGLPNACTTTWRDVYVNVPIPVLRKDHFEIDVPQWSWQDWHADVDVPHLVWKEETLVVSVPAFAVPAAPSP